MRFSILAVVSALAAAVVAAPASLVKRSPHLGAEFYRRRLAKFSQVDFRRAGYDDRVRDRYVQISRHESTHVTYLSNAIMSLHGHPLPPCKYKFTLNNLAWFVAVSKPLRTLALRLIWELPRTSKEIS
ncbi:hypothetical protein BG006_009124 [Podila minutissima]|uniref:Uncharacterized protein n=1 Tax=Podila minutissima TaxID=64525 RepID=A0A9P5SQS2_9FUNG|nr:hypothetical protein BG006_009124 [Podila minutissima]